jgi:superfamily I DNA/RNA helicase
MTYHSSKGLDFETVFLPGMDSGLSIFKKSNENLERTLFYVASTRSRRNLFISYSGDRPHPFVAAMPKNLIHNIAISDGTGSSDNPDSDDDDYY